MNDCSSDLFPRVSKVCDSCKIRKIRCVVQPRSQFCVNCIKRHTQCRFSYTKRLQRRYGPIDQGAVEPQKLASPVSEVEITDEEHRPDNEYGGDLYIDHLLASAQCGDTDRERHLMSKANELRSTFKSRNLSFMSDRAVCLVSARLGHVKLQDLVEVINAVTLAQMNECDSRGRLCTRIEGSTSQIQISMESSSSYINAYFDHVHPLYPFIDRASFEQQAYQDNLPEYLTMNVSFSILYHTVIALGCQYVTERFFNSGQEQVWQLFNIALVHLPDILLRRSSLVDLQAIVAMAILALNLSCMELENTLIAEAVMIAQQLGYHQKLDTEEKEAVCYRTFWVIYSLEKTICFFYGRSPVRYTVLGDYDIGSPVPTTIDTDIEGFDIFSTFVRCSRLLSKAYQTLFSISATLNSTNQYNALIDTLYDDLNYWKSSIPRIFQPGKTFYEHPERRSCSTLMVLRLYYAYYALITSLARLDLRINTDTSSRRKTRADMLLLHATHMIIQLTKYITMQPSTQIWILGTVPLSAMLGLFEFVICNPTHPKTDENLALLDVAASYFRRLESALAGSLHTSIFSSFAHIANQVVRERNLANGDNVTVPFGTSINENPHTPPDSSRMSIQQLITDGATTSGGHLSSMSLSYPNTTFPPPMNSHVQVGLDFLNLFDVIIPDS